MNFSDITDFVVVSFWFLLSAGVVYQLVSGVLL